MAFCYNDCVVFYVALLSSVVERVAVDGLNVYLSSLRCHWSSTQPRVPQKSEIKVSSPFSFQPRLTSLGGETLLSGCKRCIFYCFLSTLEAPSLRGVCPVFKIVSFKSTMKRCQREKLFLARGLCRLELPSEMFACFSCLFLMFV